MLVPALGKLSAIADLTAWDARPQGVTVAADTPRKSPTMLLQAGFSAAPAVNPNAAAAHLKETNHPIDSAIVDPVPDSCYC
jgi:hypothetical protein